mgnify:FL=1
MLNDLLLFSINGGGWALKPILEKISVDKIGHYYFTFLRYFISGIIALPFLIHCYMNYGCPKSYKNNVRLFMKDAAVWGSIVSVVAMAAIMANYYLLEKYGPAFVTPVAEAVLLIFNAIFSVVLLGEKITMDMIIGLVLILVGVFFIYRKDLNLF